jgi:ketosteroid isomerase-like protein
MRLKVLSGLTLLSIGWFALSTVHAQRGKVDPAISKISAAYQAAVNAEDMTKLKDLYVPEAVEMPPNEPALRGWAAIEAYYKKMFADTDGKAAITPMESMVSGNVGYEVGTFTQTIKMKSGQTINDKGKYVVLLKPGADKQWRVFYAIYNSDNPPPQMPPAPAAKK